MGVPMDRPMLTYERADKSEHWGPVWKQIDSGRSATYGSARKPPPSTSESARKPPPSTSENAKKPMNGRPGNGKRRTMSTLVSEKRSSSPA